MKKSIIFISFIAFIAFISLENINGQPVIIDKKNVVNLGLGGLAAGNIAMNYERIFNESRAASLNVGVLIPRK